MLKIGHLTSFCHSKDERKKGKIHSVQASASGIDECQNNDEFGIYSLRLLTNTCPIDIVTGKLLK